MLSTENNVRIKTLSLQRSIILRGRDDEALPQMGGHFLCPTSYEIREYDIHVPLP